MVNWVMVCLSTASFSINVNGDSFGVFKAKRGLRQGDPVSPTSLLLSWKCLTYWLKDIFSLIKDSSIIGVIWPRDWYGEDGKVLNVHVPHFNDNVADKVVWVNMNDGQAQVWKSQRSVHSQAKVKSWKLLESCGVHIITFTTTQLILLIKRRYPLSRFTSDQMLNAVRLRVEEQSEMSLDLLRTIEQMEEEENRALQSINETPAQKVAKRRKLNEEVEDLKRHLEIMPDEDDDVYTEATPLITKEDEPAEVQEVVDVVTTTKLITKVVTAASETVTAASTIISTADPQVPAATITAAPARDVPIDHVKLKAKEDPVVQRYQVMKRKPQTEAQAQKNMMMYLKNVAGFKLDYFKGMSYDDMRPIFKAKFD
nr:hypothetical protein [Tanacetum cinerariifolium]